MDARFYSVPPSDEFYKFDSQTPSQNQRNIQIDQEKVKWKMRIQCESVVNIRLHSYRVNNYRGITSIKYPMKEKNINMLLIHLCLSPSFFSFHFGILIFIRTHTYDNDNENACRITVHLHKRTLYIPIHPTQTQGIRSPDELHKSHTPHTITRKTDNKTHSKAQRKLII